MNKALIFILAFLLVYSACTEKIEETVEKQPEYPVFTETVDGIKTIKNPDFPRDGQIKYKFAEELSIGGEGESGESVLNRPFDIRVDSEGRIYVLDLGDINIKVFEADGNFIHTIGRKGQGPGEFSIPVVFDITKDNKILLFDMRSRRIMVVDLYGTQIFGFKAEGLGMEIWSDDVGNIYYSTSSLPEITVIGTEKILERKKSIYRCNQEGKNIFHFGEFRDVKLVRKMTSARSSVSSLPRHAYTTAWTVNKGGKLYLGYNKDYLINVLDFEGNPLFRFKREYIPEKYEAWKPGSILPKFNPAFYRYIILDDNKNLWFRQYTKSTVTDSIYDIFSPDGIYIQQAVVPHRIYQIKNGKAYCIIRTEEDYRIVKRFKMKELE